MDKLEACGQRSKLFYAWGLGCDFLLEFIGSGV